MKASKRGVFIRLIAATRMTQCFAHLFSYAQFLSDYTAADNPEIHFRPVFFWCPNKQPSAYFVCYKIVMLPDGLHKD